MMPILAIDLGATKAAFAVFSPDGSVLMESKELIHGKSGTEVSGIIIAEALRLKSLSASMGEIESLGICVPGISYHSTGRVWAPNIPGWDDYPLRDELSNALGGMQVYIDSDRACYILGEYWQGAARGCKHAIYLSVGTGIGAGIMIDGKVLRGAHDIAGAIGWMALDRPYQKKYDACGCFETHASGSGIARKSSYNTDDEAGLDKHSRQEQPLSTTAVFENARNGDTKARQLIAEAIECWGMAAANLVSLFNPEKIIFGGGVFGPAVHYLPDIEAEARKWAQPIAIGKTVFQASQLGGKAGLLGAALLALSGEIENKSQI